MNTYRRGFAAAAFGLLLAACAHLPPLSQATPGVAVREDLTRRFVIFVGEKTQHSPAFLDTPGTNFYCLRSFLDRKTGAVSYQVYVQDSYLGAERGWESARDGIGAPLRFVHISTDQIACDGGCSYAEEFAADIPEGELRANPKGLAVTFVAHAGDEKTLAVSGGQIAAQLAAVDTGRRDMQAAAAAPHQGKSPLSSSSSAVP